MSRETKRGLRLMVYDRTCRGSGMLPGLSHAWGAGGAMFRMLRRFDAYRGVETWEEGLRFLAEHEPDRPIAQVQFWGHGKWGSAKVAGCPLGRRALQSRHELYAPLRDIAARMQKGEDGLWWWRTCETFGADAGQAFATELSQFLDCRVAGHTYIIGHVQSGLHSLLPGQTPQWAADEGIREGTPQQPVSAYWSKIWRPKTITFLRDTVPEGY